MNHAAERSDAVRHVHPGTMDLDAVAPLLHRNTAPVSVHRAPVGIVGKRGADADPVAAGSQILTSAGREGPDSGLFRPVINSDDQDVHDETILRTCALVRTDLLT